jgi:hypothetical protein
MAYLNSGYLAVSPFCSVHPGNYRQKVTSKADFVNAGAWSGAVMPQIGLRMAALLGF